MQGTNERTVVTAVATNKPAQVRAAWSPEMVACLLDLRLGSLLPRFSTGRAPVQLQDAWNTLQSEFRAETGVDVSIQQLKNKYHQLKREYDETKRRLEAKRVSDHNDHNDHSNSNSNSIGTNDTDAPVLPLHWDIVDEAFGRSDGLRGVSFFRRGPKAEGVGAAIATATLSPPPAPAATTTPTAQNHQQQQLPPASITPAPVASVTSALLTDAGSTARRRSSFPSTQTTLPIRREWPAAAAAPTPTPTPTPTPIERVRTTNTNRYATNSNNKRFRDMNDAPAAAPTPSAKSQRMTQPTDVASAIVYASDALAAAIVESANVVAAASATNASVAADVASQLDAQAETHQRILQLLESSRQVNAALLHVLTQQQQSQNSNK